MNLPHRLACLALLAPLSLACASQAPSSVSASPTATNTTANNTAATKSSDFPLANSSHRYRFSWDGNLSGEATRNLSCQQQQCSFVTTASVPGIGSLDERSQFSWQEGRVEFEHYQRQLQLLFFPQSVRIVRSREGQVTTTDRKGRTRQYADQPDLIDSLSLEAKLRSDLVLTGKSQAEYALAEVKGVTVLTLTELPAETLELAEQRLNVRVFQRRNAEGNRVTTLWLDPKQQFLPVQIIHQDGAETYRMTWLGDTTGAR